MQTKPEKKVSLFGRFLNCVEKSGNKLPHPVTLFAILSVFIIIVSAVCAALGISAEGELVNSATGAVETTRVTAVSLFNTKGIVYMLTSAIDNFTGFAPLGTVIGAMLGVGVAESSGYISALLKRTVQMTPRQIITPVVVFLGILSNVASDAGYVVLIPIGALMFMAYGRHPMAGLAAAFAGVSGGFSANLMVGTLDPMLAGITNEAVKMVDPGYSMNPAGNLFFMMVSTFLITIVGTFVTDRIVEPRLGKFHGSAESNELADQGLTPGEKRALTLANVTFVVMAAGLVLLVIPQGSFLRNPETGSLIDNSPFMNGIIVLISLFFLIPAVIFGFVSGKFKSEKDVAAALGNAMSALGGYIALAFVAAQFINYFNYTQLGTILALAGANFLKNAGIGAIPLMILFILFSSFVNLFMGSASAKWTMLAPVFVPMFMLLGYAPELTQVAYRIGDSCTNLITPLMAYFAMIVVFAKKYDRDAGIGTLISTMVPYSIFFMISWTVLLIVWMMLGIPLGPGANLFL